MSRPFGGLIPGKTGADLLRLRAVALALRGAPLQLLDSSRRDSDYGVGLPSVVDPANTCRPSGRVTFLPLAIFEPSLAR